MKIDEDQKYQGAALVQIADHPAFTAINAYRYRGRASRSSYRVNRNRAVYLKFASRPANRLREYSFTFREANLREIRALADGGRRVFLGLVCAKAREICCLPASSLFEMIAARRHVLGRREPQYSVHVGLPRGSWFRVHVPAPDLRKAAVDYKRKIPRNVFPGQLFA